MKKRGFSLVELMMFMLFVSLIVAAAAPMITKRVQELPTRRSHGMYICYRNSNNQLSQALYSSNAMVTNGETNLCTFEPPERASLFKIQVIGGGAGGYNYVDRGETTEVHEYDYSPALSYNSLLSEFDNVAALLPTNSALKNMYDSRIISIDVRVPNAGDSGTYTYSYNPPENISCVLNPQGDYPVGFGEYSTFGPLLPADLNGYTTVGNDPLTVQFLVNSLSSINARKQRMVDDIKDPTTSLYNLYYSVQQKFDVNGNLIDSPDVGFDQRKTFSLSGDGRSNGYMNQLCYDYRLYSDYQLEGSIIDGTLEQVANNVNLPYPLPEQVLNYAGKTELLKIFNIKEPPFFTLHWLDIVGNTKTSRALAFLHELIEDAPSGKIMYRGVYFRDKSDPSTAVFTKAGLVTGDNGFLKKNLFRTVYSALAVLPASKGGLGGYLHYEYRIDTDTLGINILQGLNTLVNRFKMGYCDTPGCTDNSFTDNGITVLADAVNGDSKDYSDETSYGISETTLTYPSDVLRELIKGHTPDRFAAIKTGNNSYVTIANNATGGTSPSVIFFNQLAFSSEDYFKIDDVRGVDGDDAYGISATDTADIQRTVYTRDESYPSTNIKRFDRLNIRHSLNSRTLEAGNGGAAGQMRQIQYNELPSNCTFTIGMGGEIVNTIGPSINQSALTQVDNLNNNNNRDTNFSCPNTEINITAEGGRYSLDTVSEPFSALSQLQSPSSSYVVEGDAGGKTPLPINIFTDYAYPDGLEFGAGGNPAQITDTCVTIEGFTDYKYTTSSTYNQANREDFISGDSVCYDDDDIVTLRNGGQVDTLQFREATKGTPGAVIITW